MVRNFSGTATILFVFLQLPTNGQISSQNKKGGRKQQGKQFILIFLFFTEYVFQK